MATVQAVSHTIPVTPELAMVGAKAFLQISETAPKRRTSIAKLLDGLVLGVARMMEGQVVTGDPHFENLSETIWI